jgi:AcrR family transcriptional regulator
VANRVPAPSGKALYRVLPPGAQGMSAEQIALHQRSRLQGAMVAAVARYGYADVTIKQLVSLAGVSRSTFYRLFDGKEQCFLSTYDLIAETATERISRAYRTPADWRERLRAGFTCFAGIVSEERDASHLVLVDALGAGHRVLEHRDRLIGHFELMFRQSFQAAPEHAVVSDTTIHAIVTGIRRVAYRRLLRGQPEGLGEVVEDLLAWATAYHAPGVTPPMRPPLPARDSPAGLYEALTDSAILPLDPAQARATRSHRDRILEAVVSLASEGGYPALSIPAISARAGISNAAFYENFSDKQHAFLTAFEESNQRALLSTGEAFLGAPTWPTAVRAGIEAMLEFVRKDHVFARLAFFEILTGPPAAIEAAEQSLDTFAAMLAPGYEEHPHVPAIVSEAIIGGVWNVLQHEVGHGRAGQLPQLAPELTYIVLTPFLGAAEAAQTAGDGMG